MDVRKTGIMLGSLVFMAALLAGEVDGGQRDAVATPGPLSLKAACEKAVAQNRTMVQARIEERIARKRVWETAAEGLPQVDASVGYQNNLALATTLIPAQMFNPQAQPGEMMELKFGTKHNASASLTVSQLLFRGTYLVALKANRVYLDYTRLGREKVEEEVRALVTQTYHNQLVLERTLKVWEETAGVVRQMAYETDQMHREGFVELTDADQIRLNLNEVESRIRSLKRQCAINQKLLNFQMGTPLEQTWSLVDSIDALLAEEPTDRILNLQVGVERHLDLRMMALDRRGKELLLNKEKMTYLPQISAFFTHSRSAMRDRFDLFSRDAKWFSSSVAGLSVSVPIFSSGMRLARVQMARLELEKSRQQENDLHQQLLLSVEQSRNALMDAQDRVDTQKESCELSARIFERTREKVREGLSTSLELAQTHNQYLTAQGQYAAALLDLLNARLAYRRAISRYQE